MITRRGASRSSSLLLSRASRLSTTRGTVSLTLSLSLSPSLLLSFSFSSAVTAVAAANVPLQTGH